MRSVKRSALALMVFTSLVGALPAFAADEPPVVAAMLKNVETRYKVRPIYQSLTTESDGSVVIKGLSVQLPVQPETAQAGKVAVSVGEMKLSGITDLNNGVFDIAQAQTSDTKVEFGGAAGLFTVSMLQNNIEHWYIKALGDNPTPNDIFRTYVGVAKKASSGKITLAVGGQTFSADGYEMTWDGDPVTGAGKSSFKMNNIVIPESAIAAIDPAGTLRTLGYSNLSFDVGGDGKLDIASDKMGFDFDISYAGKDMGTLKIGAGAGEIPVALIAELQKLDGPAQPDPNTFMPLVQGIKVSRITVRFEDQSITKKIIPLVAKMQGIDEATIVANAGAMLQLGLAGLKNPTFAQKAVAAINAFLKDPRSLTILAKPAQPVTVQQLEAIDPNNLGAAIDQLGVTISAND